MAYPDTIIIEGRGFSWRQICELRRQQIEQLQAAQPRQLVLFEVKEDCRPAVERTAAGRYEEPTFLEFYQRGDGENFTRSRRGPASSQSQGA